MHFNSVFMSKTYYRIRYWLKSFTSKLVADLIRLNLRKISFWTFPEMYDHLLTDYYNHFCWISKCCKCQQRLSSLRMKTAETYSINRNPDHGYLDKTLRHSLIDHIFHLDFHSFVFVCIPLLLQQMGRLVHFFQIKKFTTSGLSRPFNFSVFLSICLFALGAVEYEL